MEKREELERKTVVEGHTCKGYFYWTDCGKEFDCEYDPDFPCDDCVFVVGYYTQDYRRGKRPWSRRWQRWE